MSWRRSILALAALVTVFVAGWSLSVSDHEFSQADPTASVVPSVTSDGEAASQDANATTGALQPTASVSAAGSAYALSFVAASGGAGGESGDGSEPLWAASRQVLEFTVNATLTRDSFTGCNHLRVIARPTPVDATDETWTHSAVTRRLGAAVGLGGAWFEGLWVDSCGATPFALWRRAGHYFGHLEVGACRDSGRVLLQLQFIHYDALNETVPDAPLRHAEAPSILFENLPRLTGDCRREQPWVGTGNDVTSYSSNERFKDYWLHVKGQKGGSTVSFTADILGRMNFGTRYRFANTAAADCDVPCMRLKVRDAHLLFIGDSHIRTLFYGVIERLGVRFPHNRIWRGGRSDVLADVNTTIAFQPASFLELDPNTLAAEAIAKIPKGARGVVVAGLGQHHSCHCMPLVQHTEVVRRSLRSLDRLVPPGMQILWLGVPAQPYNRHIHLPKPVGQARRDCRSNPRHLLYNARQADEVARLNSQRFRFIDAFGMSFGMTHTTLDGAHFYSWVRDAWIDSLLASFSS